MNQPAENPLGDVVVDFVHGVVVENAAIVQAYRTGENPWEPFTFTCHVSVVIVCAGGSQGCVRCVSITWANISLLPCISQGQHGVILTYVSSGSPNAMPVPMWALRR